MPAAQTDFLVRCFSRSGVLYGLLEVRKLEARVDFGEVPIIMAQQLLQVTNASAAKERRWLAPRRIARIIWFSNLQCKPLAFSPT